jgi:hypothetical protein
MKSTNKSGSNKSSLNNDNITIDAKHSEMINHFKSLNDSLPSLKDKLKNMINEYNNRDITKKNDIEYIIYKDKLREDINELKNKINTIINNDDINNYYLQVGNLLHSYYENIETSKNNDNDYQNFEQNLINYDNFEEDDNFEEEEEEDDDFEIIRPFVESDSSMVIPDKILISTNDNDKIKKKDMTKDISKDISKDILKENAKNKNNSYKSVLQFFNSREIKSSEDNISMEDSTINEVVNNNGGGDPSYTSMKISDFVKEESTFRKKNVLEEYLQKIDPNYVSKIKIDLNIFKCPNCTIEMTVYHSDGIQICEKCGIQQNILIESDRPSFKDPPMEVCYFSYKRINHYNEFLQSTKIIYQCVKNNLLIILKKLNYKIF